MIIKGIQPPPENEFQRLERDYPEIVKWLRLLGGNLAKINSYQPTLDPASIGANSESSQTFAVEGLRVNDVVIVNKPTSTTDISISQAFVSDKDELTIKFRNHSVGAIDLTSEVYRIIAIRM